MAVVVAGAMAAVGRRWRDGAVVVVVVNEGKEVINIFPLLKPPILGELYFLEGGGFWRICKNL